MTNNTSRPRLRAKLFLLLPMAMCAVSCFGSGLRRQRLLVDHTFKTVGVPRAPTTARIDPVRIHEDMLGCVVIVAFWDQPHAVANWARNRVLDEAVNHTKFAGNVDIWEIQSKGKAGTVRIDADRGLVQIVTAPAYECPPASGCERS